MEFMFEGGEFVRLTRVLEYTDVQVGDYGVVWGVYGHPPTVYEACFVTQSGKLSDRRFDADDVELIRDIRQVPCAYRLVEILSTLERANNGLKNRQSEAR